MKALIFQGLGKKALEERPKPTIVEPTDAIVTICGTDLHILKGDVPTCQPCRGLGHEGVGFIEAVGSGVVTFKPEERVLISCISACGKCEYYRKGMVLALCQRWMSWQYHRRDTSRVCTHSLRRHESLPSRGRCRRGSACHVILPTGFECGVLNGKDTAGSNRCNCGCGPVGLAALLTAQFFSPFDIVMVDVDDNRLTVSTRFGATAAVSSSDGKAAEAIMRLTGGRGVDTAIEAVGIRTIAVSSHFLHNAEKP
jgi:alcohol dehydrogenase